MQASNENHPQPVLSSVRSAVLRELADDDVRDIQHDKGMEKVRAGTHRFDIHPAQVIFMQPRGFFIDRAEDRQKRMEQNAAAVKRYNRMVVDVTDDGFVVREK